MHAMTPKRVVVFILICFIFAGCAAKPTKFRGQILTPFQKGVDYFWEEDIQGFFLYVIADGETCEEKSREISQGIAVKYRQGTLPMAPLKTVHHGKYCESQGSYKFVEITD